MERRKAEPGDLPRLVEIIVVSMPDDDTYLYEWPLHSIYPGVMESIWEFRLKKLLSKCHVIVEDGNVIAFAVWTQESHFPAEQRDECPPEDLAEKFKLVGSRTDVFEKASAWIRDKIKGAGIQEWFTMDLLVTDRPFRCRGAAAMLLEEFVKEAGGGYCLVEASRMGEPQYAKEGFEHVMDMPVKVKGEEEGTSVTVMWKQPTAAEITVRWSPPPPSPPLPPPLASLPEEDLSFMQTLKESDGRKMGFIK